MLLQEKHHAGILSAYYLALKDNFGEAGLAIFRKAEQFYGERRGRRMALRALRDGRELNYAAYFEYGELLSTEGACDADFEAGEERVDECVTRCPWAKEFARLNCVECGEFYCKEIDAAVVRGFNPYLGYELTGNIYGDGCCRFIYWDGSISPGMFQRMGAPEGAKLGFDFHCADLYQAYAHTVKAAKPRQYAAVMENVKAYLENTYGAEFLKELDAMRDRDFEDICAS